MFYGNHYFKPIVGEFSDTVGGKLTLPDGATLLRAGTMLAYKTASREEFDVCEGGKGLQGWLTQPMDAVGLEMLNVVLNTNPNYNLKSGQEVSARVMKVGNEFEVEGLGASAYGNLVVSATTTGFIASNTARYTPLSTNKGGFIQAQPGQVANFELVAADLTPEIAGNRRIHVKYIGGGYIIPTP
jgi:hypothetical protein